MKITRNNEVSTFTGYLGGMCKVDKRIRNWRSAFHGIKVIKSGVELSNSVYSLCCEQFQFLSFRVWEGDGRLQNTDQELSTE